MLRTNTREVKDEQWPPHNTLQAVFPPARAATNGRSALSSPQPAGPSPRVAIFHVLTAPPTHSYGWRAWLLAKKVQNYLLPPLFWHLVAAVATLSSKMAATTELGTIDSGEPRGGERRGRALWSRRGGVGVGMECEWPKYNLGQRQTVSKVQGNKNGSTNRPIIALVEKLKCSSDS